jgi:PII-like signaling protein
MKTEAEQVLCRIHLTSTARHGAEPLYEWIVHTTHRLGLQGATVLRGILGVAADGRLLAEHAWSVVREVPMVVEIVDEAPRIESLLAEVEPVLREGTITLERAHVVLYRHGAESPAPARTGVVSVAGSQDASRSGEVRTMKPYENGVLLRIFIGEDDREPGSGRPLHEALVMRARESHLAGATVLKGPLGFGKRSRVHAARLLALSTDLPIVIEIVDAEDSVQAFLPVVDELVQEGLVTLETVKIIKYVEGQV